MPARLITSAHFAISDLTNGSISASGMLISVPPSAVIRFFTSGSASAFCTAA